MAEKSLDELKKSLRTIESVGEKMLSRVELMEFAERVKGEKLSIEREELESEIEKAKAMKRQEIYNAIKALSEIGQVVCYPLPEEVDPKTTLRSLRIRLGREKRSDIKLELKEDNTLLAYKFR